MSWSSATPGSVVPSAVSVFATPARVLGNAASVAAHGPAPANSEALEHVAAAAERWQTYHHKRWQTCQHIAICP